MKKFFASCILFFSFSSHAYLTNGESAELVPENQYRVSLEPQINYYNFSLHFDTGAGEDAQVRLSTGVGNGGFHFDFFYKQVPFPDYENQPAIGYKIGASFARDGGASVVTPMVMPLISKNFNYKKTKWTPYLSLPIGVSAYQSRSSTPTHGVFGCEISPGSVEEMQFGAEVGVNIKDSFSYFSAYVSFFFEPTERIIENN